MNAAKFLVTATALGALVACGKAPEEIRSMASRAVALSEAPLAGTTRVAPVVQTSTVAASLVLPFARLSEVANAKAPGEFAKGGRERPCKRIGPKGSLPFGGSFDLTKEVCMDVDYQVTAKRGAIAIASGAQPASVRVAVPIRFDGWAGFTGDLAGVLKLNRKNFEAAVDAWVDLSIDVGPNWCPRVSGTADFRWVTPAKVEVAGGVWVPIDGLVEDELRARMRELKTALESAIDCQPVRAELGKLWAAQSVPLPAGGGLEGHLQLQPTGMGFSGLKVGAQAISFTVQAQAKVSVADKPLERAELALPALERVAAAPGRIALAVPVHAPYGQLTAAVEAAVVGRSFSADTPAGSVEVKVKGVRLYPSNENLVIGLDFEADLPGRVLDVTGQVFLYGRPMVDGSGRRVSVADLKFSRILDNAVWSAASLVFEQQIREAVAGAATLDLGSAMEEAKTLLANQLASVHARTGVRVDLSHPRIAIGRIVPAQDVLVVEGLFESGAEVQLSVPVTSMQ